MRKTLWNQARFYDTIQNMKQCPFFGVCGGCKYDFASDDYRTKKLAALPKIPTSDSPIWIPHGLRRRADFCFAGGRFGFFESGTKNIVQITHCPNVVDEINAILPKLAALPWSGSGACLVTMCDNGIDVAINSNVPYVTPEFRRAIENLGAIRVTWNGTTIMRSDDPVVTFANHRMPYPSGAFLQPSILGADTMRDLVVKHTVGYTRIADLFCGLGNFTFATNADGFDVVGTGVKRDLFKRPLTVGMLDTYDCVIMDPPRAGADAQCRELARSNVKRVIYISCNPNTFVRDMQTLNRGGYKLQTLIPLDQFTGASHWELFSVFDK